MEVITIVVILFMIGLNSWLLKHEEYLNRKVDNIIDEIKSFFTYPPLKNLMEKSNQDETIEHKIWILENCIEHLECVRQALIEQDQDKSDIQQQKTEKR